MKKILAAALLILPTFLLSETRFSLNIGHNQVINSVTHDRETGYLYTVSDDGKLMVHDIDNNRVYRNIQLSSLQLKNIVKHPTESIIAVYETDNLNVYQISVWDIDKGEKLYSHALAESPLFMDFSPRGTYLIYTSARWNSITFLDSEKGDILPVIDTGFGIVPSMFISSSEKTLVAYGPSGKIFYFDLITGKAKSERPINTVNDLKDVNFHSKGRFMTGVKGSKLHLIDIVHGNIVDSIDLGDIRDTSMLGDTVTVLIQQNSYYIIKKIIIQNNVLLENVQNDRDIPFSQAVYMTENYIILPGITGELHVFDSNTLMPGSYDIVHLDGISYVQKRNGRLYFLKSGNIFNFTEDYSSVDTVVSNTQVNGFYVTDDVFIYWDRNMRLFSYNEEADIAIEILNIDDGIKSVVSYEKVIAVLGSNGTLYVVPLSNTGAFRKFPTKGLNSIVMTNPSTILGGRNVGGTFDTALIQINADTGESIGLENPNTMIVKISFDNVTETVYTLGVQLRRGRQYTVISEMVNGDYTQPEPLAAFKGIDNTIRFAADPLSTKFFTSTGTNGLEMYSWGGFTQLSDNSHLTSGLLVTESHLVSTNKDDSLSFWDKSNGRFLCDVYILDDEDILITYENGTYYTTDTGKDVIQYFNKGRIISDTSRFFEFNPF